MRDAAKADLVADLRRYGGYSRLIPVPDFLLGAVPNYDDDRDKACRRTERSGQELENPERANTLARVAGAAWDLATGFLEQEGYLALVALDERLQQLHAHAADEVEEGRQQLRFLQLMEELDGLVKRVGPNLLINAVSADTHDEGAAEWFTWQPWPGKTEGKRHVLQIYRADDVPAGTPVGDGQELRGYADLAGWIQARRDEVDPLDAAFLVDDGTDWGAYKRRVQDGVADLERSQAVLDLRRSTVAQVRRDYEVLGEVPGFDSGAFESKLTHVAVRVTHLQTNRYFVVLEVAHMLHSERGLNMTAIYTRLLQEVKAVDPEAELAFGSYDALADSLRKTYNSSVADMREKGRRAIDPTWSEDE